MSITNRIVNNALLTLNKYAILLVVICFAPFVLFSLFLFFNIEDTKKKNNIYIYSVEPITRKVTVNLKSILFKIPIQRTTAFK